MCAEVIERFARHRLLERSTSCRWGSEPELAAKVLQGKVNLLMKIMIETCSKIISTLLLLNVTVIVMLLSSCYIYSKDYFINDLENCIGGSLQRKYNNNKFFRIGSSLIRENFQSYEYDIFSTFYFFYHTYRIEHF